MRVKPYNEADEKVRRQEGRVATLRQLGGGSQLLWTVERPERLGVEELPLGRQRGEELVAHARLVEAGLKVAMPLEDHPWGDRGFSVTDPIGNAVYLFSDREPADEFKQYYLA